VDEDEDAGEHGREAPLVAGVCGVWETAGFADQAGVVVGFIAVAVSVFADEVLDVVELVVELMGYCFVAWGLELEAGWGGAQGDVQL